MWQKLLNLDRRIIFLVVGVVILLAIFSPLNIPGLEAGEQVKTLYDNIEALAPGDRILLSFDFDPGSKPELEPMAYVVTKHCLKKNLKIIVMNLWITGTTLANEILTKSVEQFEEKHGQTKKYGEDYVFLGWKPMPVSVISGLGTDWYKVYPTDSKGTDLKTLSIMKDVKSLNDIKFMVDFNAGDPGAETWLTYGADVYKFNMGVGCTAVIMPQVIPYYQSGQFKGLIGGIRGAAEYEKLVDEPGKGIAAMDAISIVHFFMIFLIIIANIAYFKTRKKAQ